MRMYGHRSEHWPFDDIYPSRGQTRLCEGSRAEEIVALDVVEDPDRGNWQDGTPYWGWEDAGEPGRWHMVFPHLIHLRVCFPYGLEATEERGRGRRVHLLVTEAKP